MRHEKPKDPVWLMRPATHFSFSDVVIATPSGYMEDSYEMIQIGGYIFNASIPQFVLTARTQIY